MGMLKVEYLPLSGKYESLDHGMLFHYVGHGRI